jgi:Flp pilus assembly protein TadG
MMGIYISPKFKKVFLSCHLQRMVIEMLLKQKYYKEESGQSIVLFALLFVILIGFGALTIDIGRIAVEKSSLQNAVDAAALAAVYDLPNESAAKQTAENYAKANGVNADVTVSFLNADQKVAVSVIKPVEYTFAKVLGLNRTNVSAQAAATIANVFHPFQYVLFSGSNMDLLTLTGQNVITGDVHSNNSILINGQTDVSGSVTAVGNIDNSGLTADEVKTHSDNIAMPDFSSVVKTAYVYSNGTQDLTISADQLNSLLSSHAAVYFDGNVVINGSGITSTGSMIASGDITFHGSGVNMTSAAAVCLCSLNGNVNFDGGGEEMYGLIYAPNGTVTLNGKSDRMFGSIIANEINSNGGMNITYNGDAVSKSVPPTKGTLVS